MLFRCRHEFPPLFADCRCLLLSRRYVAFRRHTPHYYRYCCFIIALLIRRYAPDACRAVSRVTFSVFIDAATFERCQLIRHLSFSIRAER